MHPEILNLSNQLFYEGKIQNGYKYEDKNLFLDKDKPVLIINVSGKEQKFGTSIQNNKEAETVSQLIEYLTNGIKNTQGWNDRKVYCKDKFWCITPYFAQQTLLDEKLSNMNMSDQIVTIDASQGR